MDEDLLVYQQDEVHTIPTSQEEFSVAGKLRIIERQNGALIEWSSAEDETNPENDWAVVNTSAVTFTHHNTSDSVEISTPRRHVRPISLELIDLRSYKLSDTGSLVLIQRDGSTHPALQFPGKDAAYFVEVLRRYVAVKQSEKDPTLFLLKDKKQADLDAKLSALNLVPAAPRRRRLLPNYHHRHRHGAASSSSGTNTRRSPLEGEGNVAKNHNGESPGRSGSPRPHSAAGGNSQQFPHSNAGPPGAMVPWANTPQRVMGFFNNFKRDPYTTTLSTLSKFYDNVLYYEWDDGLPSERDEEENPFSSLNGFDDLEPGFQVVSLKGELATRGVVERLPPLSSRDYSDYCDVDGRVTEPQLLRRRIFQGGLHPSLRSELWCCLLGHYDWSWTREEREQRRQERQQQYDLLKVQWTTVTPEQEVRNTGFRDRKSLIEKDVNRTDRSHPFYEGEDNPNVDLLYNILMSYVMYNFDLGYVQGMSDLLAPILYVTQNECTAFWCFAGYIDMVYRNFDMDQSGMKEQLHGLQQLIAVVDPEFMSYLESKESANLYFCFRWLLVRYKRELSYTDTLRLWEVLWSGEPCLNFHLLVAAAILDHERNTIMENKFGFTEILKHINDTSQRLDLEQTLRSAQAIYEQLAASPGVPAAILRLLGLPIPEQEDALELAEEAKTQDTPDTPAGLPGDDSCSNKDNDLEETASATNKAVIVTHSNDGGAKKGEDFVLYKRVTDADNDGDEEFVSEEDDGNSGGSNGSRSGCTSRGNTKAECGNTGEKDANNSASESTGIVGGLGQKGLVGTVTTMLGSAVRHIAGDEFTTELFSPISSLTTESLFEDALSTQFM